MEENKRKLDDVSVQQVSGGYKEEDGYRYYTVFGADDNCTACEACLSVCPLQCISFTPFAVIDLNSCIRCGSCQAICPSGAIGWRTIAEKIEE